MMCCLDVRERPQGVCNMLTWPGGGGSPSCEENTSRGRMVRLWESPDDGDVMLVSVALVHRPAAHRREGNSLVKGCVCLAVSHGRDMDQYLQALWDGQNTERCGR